MLAEVSTVYDHGSVMTVTLECSTHLPTRNFLGCRDRYGAVQSGCSSDRFGDCVRDGMAKPSIDDADLWYRERGYRRRCCQRSRSLGAMTERRGLSFGEFGITPSGRSSPTPHRAPVVKR